MTLEIFLKKFELKRKHKFYQISKSPKFDNKPLINSINLFKKKYNIKTKNFFLVSGLISGGLSNFWGAGLETPKSSYLKKYFFGKSILKEQKYIDRELKIDRNKLSFFDFFFNQKIIKKMLNKSDKNVYFSKFLLAIKHYEKKRLTIHDYDKVDLLSGYNKYIYNSKFYIAKLLKNKNFTYTPDTFVKNIKKHKKKYKIISNNKKIYNLNFNKLIISGGTVTKLY